VQLSVEVVRDLATSGFTIPWSGSIYVSCDGTVKVTLTKRYILHVDTNSVYCFPNVDVLFMYLKNGLVLKQMTFKVCEVFD